MTWSLVARDPVSGALGVAAASCFFAVGAVCPFIAGDALALSTQARGHPPHGPKALALHRDGIGPEAVLATLLDDDPERSLRQIHLIDAQGRIAAYTGESCTGWAGSARAENVSVAGNMLAGPAVIEGALAAYAAAEALPFADRLLAGLLGGQAAGGDRRGQQAAALQIQLRDGLRLVDLRIDDDTDALAALGRLHEAARKDFHPFMRSFASSDDFKSVLGS